MVAAATVATFAWWSSLSLVLDATRPAPDALADALQHAATAPWSEHSDPTAGASSLEHSLNPEWDFMARTFLVLALANDALADPRKANANLAIVDRIIDDTVAAERKHGQTYFLLPYARQRRFIDGSERSVFVDGEIALMLAARTMVADKPAYRDALRLRAGLIAAQMGRGPVLSAESYPDEAWTFCNTTALVALRASDRILHTDHQPLIDAWLAMARDKLIDPTSGLLVSSFTYSGEPLDGPEGSTLWMTAHNLLVLDPEMAREQYALAKAQLGAGFGGLAWADEWPSDDAFADRRGRDVDSGLVIPVLGASPGSSGMMVLAASAFGDEPQRDALLRSLQLGAFPTGSHGGTHFAAAGNIGNAVILYALRFGPFWERLEEEAA